MLTSCLFSSHLYGWSQRSRDRRGRIGHKISKHQLWHHKDGWATWHVVLVSEYHQLGPQQAQSRSNWTAVEATVTPSTPRPIASPHSIKHQLRQTVLASFFDDFTIDYRLIIEKSMNTEREKRKQMAWKPARWLASRFFRLFCKTRWKRGGGNPLNHLFSWMTIVNLFSLAGIDDWWPTKGSLFVLPRVLHGFIPFGRVENNKSEGESKSLSSRKAL